MGVRALRELDELKHSAVRRERVLETKMEAAHPGDYRRAKRHWMLLADMMLKSVAVLRLPEEERADEAEKQAVDGFAEGFIQHHHCLVCDRFPEDIVTLMLRWGHG